MTPPAQVTVTASGGLLGADQPSLGPDVPSYVLRAQALLPPPPETQTHSSFTPGNPALTVRDTSRPPPPPRPGGCQARDAPLHSPQSPPAETRRSNLLLPPAHGLPALPSGTLLSPLRPVCTLTSSFLLSIITDSVIT